MKHKKIVAIALGVLATVILFSVVYTQFATKRVMAPSTPAAQQQKVTGKGGAMMQSAIPVADPETMADVSMAIDAQFAEDAAALDAEIAAETAAIEGELTSLNELNETYDENAY
jgi:cytochrome c oxidase assembly factor CtaG